MTDDNQTIFCDTTAAFTLTLPTLASSDAGWCIYVLKTTTDANPVWIAPPSGTINGFTKVRRAVPFSLVKVLWTGSGFFAQRSFGVPIGSLIPHYGSTLPQGCLHPDGTTFVAADFVELNSILSGNTKPNIAERILVPQDTTAVASLVTSGGSGIDGNTRGATGGTELHTLTTAQMPVHSHGVTDPGHAHTVPLSFTGLLDQGLNSNSNVPNSSNTSTSTNTTGITINNAGSGSAHQNMPPSIVVPYVLVAE